MRARRTPDGAAEETAAADSPVPQRVPLPNAAVAAQPSALTALQASSNSEIARAMGPGPAAERAADRVAGVVSADNSVPAGDADAVHHLQPLLGHDPGSVRIHRDADTPDLLRAHAFTVGSDVYIGRGEPGPSTAAGRGLLAHELTHVVQQRSAAVLQRQEIPTDLNSTPDYRNLTQAALKVRYDRIVWVLAQFTMSTPETALLDQQISAIGTELLRRSALAAGRTFADADIEQSRAYFVQNARTEHDSCIVALNKGLKLITGQSGLATTPESIEATMAKVIAAGYAGEAHEIFFRTANDRITRGSARPARVAESVWSALVAMSGGDPGWSVFTMSLLDGYHSVTLTLNAADPARPRVFWSDQWQSKGGWKEYSRDALDAEVTKLVQGWWDGQEEGRKHTTVVRLWRMRATPEAVAP